VVVQPSVYGTDNACTVDAVRRITAEQIRGLNWHVQVYTRTSVIAALKDHLARMPFPVVIDHFGRGNPAQVPAQPDFAALLDLVRSGAVYVKISGAYRISDKAPDFADVTPLAQALVAANPDPIVWGADWPHPNSDYGRGKPLTEISPPFPIDDGLLLNQLPKWVPEAAARKKILVDNPARLYGVAAVAG
jgi:predicted TIM-barrel fold metal-dependent hydrolase